MKNKRAFTLIEVIIILLVMSVAATFFVTYLGSSFTKSPASANLVGSQYSLAEKMEILTSQYRKAITDANEAKTTLDLCAFKTTYVDGLTINGKSIVDAAHTLCDYELTGITNPVLLVTLTDGQQTLQSIFTN